MWEEVIYIYCTPGVPNNFPVPPVGSLYKINVDGTAFSTQKEASVGVIIRYDKGLVVAAFEQEDLCSVGCFGGGGKGFWSWPSIG